MRSERESAAVLAEMLNRSGGNLDSEEYAVKMVTANTINRINNSKPLKRAAAVKNIVGMMPEYGWSLAELAPGIFMALRLDSRYVRDKLAGRSGTVTLKQSFTEKEVYAIEYGGDVSKIISSEKD